MSNRDIQSKTTRPFPFLFGEDETDFPGLAETGRRIMEGIDRHVKASAIQPTGPVLWMYDHIGNGRVRLRAGVPVPEGVQGAGSLKVERFPEWTCMSTTHEGSMADIGKAWDRFTGEVRRMGLVPKNINREIYHRWIAFDAMENLTELQVEVEP